MLARNRELTGMTEVRRILLRALSSRERPVVALAGSMTPIRSTRRYEMGHWGDIGQERDEAGRFGVRSRSTSIPQGRRTVVPLALCIQSGGRYRADVLQSRSMAQ